MAKKSIQRVKAIDIDSNSIVECNPKDVVEINVVPCVSNPYGGDGWLVIPASVRLICAPERVPWPTRLIRIERAQGTRRRPFTYIRYEHAVKECYPGGPTYTESGCSVRNEADARDPLFHRLTQRERNRILKAVQVQS